jgi:hypothetical protein
MRISDEDLRTKSNQSLTASPFENGLQKRKGTVCRIQQTVPFLYPIKARNYFFSGAGAGAGAGVSAFFSSPAGAGAGAGSGAFCSAGAGGGGASSFFLQPMAKEKTTNNITTSTKVIIFRILIHLLCLS